MKKYNKLIIGGELDMNGKQLSEFVSEFRDKYIGKQMDIQEIKKLLNDNYQTKINDIIEDKNIVSIDIEPVNIQDHEMNICINRLNVITRKDIITYLVAEQETTSVMINSVKQKYYFDKENELFVSSVKMDEKIALFNACYETMIKYNGEFFYQDRCATEEETIEFNDKIFDEIVNSGKTIQEIKKIYSESEECEEESR